MVGGKLSAPLPIQVGASAPTSNLLEDRKSPGFQRRFGVHEIREVRPTFSFGNKTSEGVVQPLSLVWPRLDT